MVDGASGNLGTLLAFSNGNGFDQYTVVKNGYVYGVRVDGTVVPETTVSVSFTGINCTGTGYIAALGAGDRRYFKAVIYKPFVNKIFRFANPVNGMVSPVTPPTILSRENNLGACVAPSAAVANMFALEEITPATLGITASGNPLSVASPVTIP